MTSNTATVEVLSAEVRALMVGSRQVTLSVYRQLDHVAPDQIEPFGRIRDNKDREHELNTYGHRTGYRLAYVVGRSIESGALVRSSLSERVSTLIAYRPTLDGFDVWCNAQHWADPETEDAYTAGTRTAGFPVPDCPELRLALPGLFKVECPDHDGALELRTGGGRATALHGRPMVATPATADAETVDGIEEALRAEAAHYAETVRANRAIYDAWAALQLIVLAGLR